MPSSPWTRPAALAAIRPSPRLETETRTQLWSAIVERARAAEAAVKLETAVVDGALAVDATTDAIADDWPAEYVAAFRRLGLDETYGTETLAGLTGAFHGLSEAQLGGLANSVKGTVMELRVRDMIQAGEIDGVGSADADVYLAEGLTQTGHDIEIVDKSGEVTETVQVKSGSWSDVAPRLNEYRLSDIPVAVTAETAAKATDAGFATAIIDTGISGADLAAQTGAIVDTLGLGHMVDEWVPEFAVVSLMAAAALRVRSGQSVAEVKSWLVGELQNVGVSNAAGVAVQLMTGLVVLRPVAVLGARWGLARAATAGSSVVALRRSRQSLRAIATPIR